MVLKQNCLWSKKEKNGSRTWRETPEIDKKNLNIYRENVETKNTFSPIQENSITQGEQSKIIGKEFDHLIKVTNKWNTTRNWASISGIQD